MREPLLYNIYFEAAAIAFMVVVNIFLMTRYAAETEVNREFRKLAVYVLAACILDISTAATISYGSHIPSVVNLLFNTVYIVTVLALGYQFMRYVSAYVYHGDS